MRYVLIEECKDGTVRTMELLEKTDASAKKAAKLYWEDEKNTVSVRKLKEAEYREWTNDDEVGLWITNFGAEIWRS